ncbi:MAG: polysaccharide lyase family protein, partial [Planctomycetota bacterium]
MKRLTVLWTGWLALVAAGPPAPTDTGGDTVEMKTLWEIGSPGPVAGEFALGLDGFHLYPSRFPSGPLYVVGRSNSAHDWAPVQPGPRDAWAGSRRHTFTVRFGLDESNAGAACRLIIDLADAHLRTPPKLGIRINDFVRECQTDSGSANAVELRPPGGHPQRIVVDVPGSALRRGDNTLTIT